MKLWLENPLQYRKNSHYLDFAAWIFSMIIVFPFASYILIFWQVLHPRFHPWQGRDRIAVSPTLSHPPQKDECFCSEERNKKGNMGKTHPAGLYGGAALVPDWIGHFPTLLHWAAHVSPVSSGPISSLLVHRTALVLLACRRAVSREHRWRREMWWWWDFYLLKDTCYVPP